MPGGSLRKRKRRSHQKCGPKLVACFRILMLFVLVELLVLLYTGFTFVQQQYYDGGNVRVEPMQHQDPQSSELLQSGDAPLDNYFTRQQKRRNGEAPVPLVVGGSDGSGTRAFVDVLQRLGVPMVVDDFHTLDMHGKNLFAGQGWPPMAKMVLRALQDQNVSSLLQLDLTVDAWPKSIRSNLKSLQYDLGRRELATRGRMAHQQSNKTAAELFAKHISHGFKAPITMLLLPLLRAYLYPNTGFKYLHIVRDGRDVALSNNQSPVQKFYEYAYKNDVEERIDKYRNMAPVFGMQLWNDWNANLYEWEQRQEQRQSKEQQSTNTSNAFFDYLVVRTEDLLSTQQSKFETLLRLADFVGSPRTSLELCCWSREEARDLGQSNQMKGRVGPQRRAEQLMHLKRQRQQEAASATDAFNKPKTGIEEQKHDLALQSYKRLYGGGNSQLAHLRHEQQHERRLLVSEEEDDSENSGPSTTSEGVVDRVTMQPSSNEDDKVYPRRRLWGWYSYLFRENNAGKLASYQVKVLQERYATASASSAGDLTFGSISDRYGKWDGMLRLNPDLSKTLHKEGAKALKMFGYYPPRRFMDRPSPSTVEDFACDETVVCPGETPPQRGS